MSNASLETADIVIIGAGPAGLTAALYCARSRLKTVILEKQVIGGRIIMSEVIENYPGFPGGITTQELIQRMEQQVRDLGVEFITDEVLSVDPDRNLITCQEHTFSYGACIVAVGAKPRKLNVLGEEKFTGRGVSYCATCDAPFFREKIVAVVGGGNAVAEEALYLSRFARTVYVVHRRSEMRASIILQERLKANPKIQFILNSVITEIAGETKVNAVTIKDVISGSVRSIDLDGVFVYIGYEPETEFLKNVVVCDDAGFIKATPDGLTTVAGIIACGDCIKKPLYQVVIACSEGAIAADSAYKYLSEKRNN